MACEATAAVSRPRCATIRNRLRGCAFLTAMLVGTASHAAVAQGDVDVPLVIRDVTIVDTRDGRLRPGMDVEIAGGKIARIARTDRSKTRAGVSSIDGRGKFVVPGFNDMHVHPLQPDYDVRLVFPMMVANGITGVRVMASSPPQLSQRRAGTLPMGSVAPEILQMAGPPILGATAPTPQAAVVEVAKQKQMGAEFIKIIDGGPVEYQPGAYMAVVDEAVRSGLPVGGHVPATLDIRDVVAHRMTSVEHLGPDAGLIQACSTDEAALRAAFLKIPSTYRALEPALFKTPSIALPPVVLALFRRMIDTFDEKKCGELARTFAASGTWQVPTLIRMQTNYVPTDPRFATDPNLRYVEAANVRQWRMLLSRFERIPAADRATLADLFRLELRVTRLFDANGAKMLAGSDFGGSWLTPGFSLHEEFDLLSRAGVAPLKVLQMTTLLPARYMRREATMGTVEVGKDANLVLLDADPVASVGALHRIRGVLRAGRYYPRARLDAMLREAERLAATNQETPAAATAN